MSADPEAALHNALTASTPILLIWLRHLGAAGTVVDRVAALLGIEPPQVVDSVEAALARSEQAIFLLPADETATIEALEVLRDRFRGRRLVVLALEGGDGQRALARAPALASWLRGSTVSLADVEVDLDAERAHFEELHGHSPERFVEDWEAGRVGGDIRTLTTLVRARTLLP